MHKFHFKKKKSECFTLSQLSSKATGQMSQLSLLCTGALFQSLSSRAPCGRKAAYGHWQDLEQYVLGCFCNWSLSSFRAGEGSNCWVLLFPAEKRSQKIHFNWIQIPLLKTYCVNTVPDPEGYLKDNLRAHLPSRRRLSGRKASCNYHHNTIWWGLPQWSSD